MNTGTLKSRVIELVDDHANADQLGVVYPTPERPS